MSTAAHRDPRLRRAPAVDLPTAALRLQLGADALRAELRGTGPAPLEAAPLEAVAVAECPEPVPVAAVPPHPPAPALERPAPAPAVFGTEHGRRLDWSSRHDPRSLAYGIRPRLAGSAPITEHRWPVGPVGDQGSEGACVGWGIRDALNAQAAGDADLDAAAAGECYRLARRLDDVPGESYAGTSVLAGLQAAVKLGWAGGFLWAFGTRDVAQAVLQRGPVVIGIPWLTGMGETGPGGLVTLAGDDVGAGHCLAVVGITRTGPQGQPGPYFTWQNSWGPAYGVGGLGYIHHRDLARLLHGAGEAAILTPGPPA